MQTLLNQWFHISLPSIISADLPRTEAHFKRFKWSILQWATKVLRHFVILDYLRQISSLISIILPPPPFSMLDFLSLELASFLYNTEKGGGGGGGVFSKKNRCVNGEEGIGKKKPQ